MKDYPEFSSLEKKIDPNNPFCALYFLSSGESFYIEPVFYTQLMGFKDHFPDKFPLIIDKMLELVKKNQKIVQLQEIRLSLTIEQNDLMTKSRNARKILEKGNKVKVSMRIFGRQFAHQDLGKAVIDRFVETLADCSDVDGPVKLDGRSLMTILTPKK